MLSDPKAKYMKAILTFEQACYLNLKSTLNVKYVV